jgi:hypothetical protein
LCGGGGYSHADPSLALCTTTNCTSTMWEVWPSTIAAVQAGCLLCVSLLCARNVSQSILPNSTCGTHVPQHTSVREPGLPAAHQAWIRVRSVWHIDGLDHAEHAHTLVMLRLCLAASACSTALYTHIDCARSRPYFALQHQHRARHDIYTTVPAAQSM